MSKATVDILEDFLNSISFELIVTGWSNDADGTYIEVENILYARTSLEIYTDNNQYTITAVEGNVITIAEQIVITGKVYLQKPFYFHGTPYATNAKLTRISNWKNKTPFIYVFEMLREREYNLYKEGGCIDKESSLVMLFMDGCSEKWDTDEHYEYAINRMRELWESFKQGMRNYTKFVYDEIGYFDVINHANFGEYFDKKGYKNHIFSDKISGIEVRFDLPIAVQLTCE